MNRHYSRCLTFGISALGLAAASAMLLKSLPTYAATVYWDATSPTGTPADGGSGTWVAGGNNWRTATSGGSQTTFTAGSQAYFPNPGAGDYTVTVSGTVQVSGAATNTGAAIFSAADSSHPYTYDGTGTIQLSGNGYIHANSAVWFKSGLNIDNNNFVLTFYNGAKVDALVKGSGAVNKNSSGTVALNNTGNTFSGKLTATEGTLVYTSIKDVSGGASAVGAPTTAANGTIDLGSGALAINFKYTGTGDSTNRVINLAGTTGTVTLDMSGTNTLTYTSALTATGAGAKTLALTGSTTGVGVLQGAIVNNSGTNTTGLSKSGSGKWTLSGTNTFTGATDISGGTLQIGGSGRLGPANYAGAITLSNNALLQFSSSTGQTFSGKVSGTGNITKDTSNSDLTLSNTTNSINGTITAGYGRLVAGAATNVNGANLVQTSLGQLTLNGNGATYGNAINISTTGYTATSGDAQNNADGAIRLNNGTLSNTVTLSGNSRIGSYGSTTNTVSGQITGGYGIDFYGIAQGNASTNFVISNTSNDYSGDTTIYNSLYNLTSTASVTSTTLKLGASNVIPNGTGKGNVVFAIFSNGLNLPNATDVLDLNGYSDTINGVSVSSGTFNTKITNSSTTTASTLQIGDNDASSTYGGTITDTDATGSLALTKIGGGTLTLTNAGTFNYHGATNVTGGTLLVNGTLSANSNVTVGTNGTLGGTGTINGATVVHGVHSPGNSPGIQTFGGNLTYSKALPADPSPSVLWQLIGNTTTNAFNPNAIFDSVVVDGNLAFTDATDLVLSFDSTGTAVDWTDAFWATSHTGTNGWLLYSVTGSITNGSNLTVVADNWLDSNAGQFNSLRVGSFFDVFVDLNGVYLNYNYVPVPEPMTMALLATGLFMIAGRRGRPTASR